MSSYNSCGSKMYRPEKNAFSRKQRITRQPLGSKRSVFKHDPLVVLTYFVLLGVIISGLTSFGL
jgi:hypothetical protein